MGGLTYSCLLDVCSRYRASLPVPVAWHLRWGTQAVHGHRHTRSDSQRGAYVHGAYIHTDGQRRGTPYYYYLF